MRARNLVIEVTILGITRLNQFIELTCREDRQIADAISLNPVETLNHDELHVRLMTS